MFRSACKLGEVSLCLRQVAIRSTSVFPPNTLLQHNANSGFIEELEFVCACINYKRVQVLRPATFAPKKLFCGPSKCNQETSTILVLTR